MKRNEYVVDAAAVASALGRTDALGSAANKLITESVCHAPHLLDAEVGQVLRKGERRGEISDEIARSALKTLARVIDYRYPHTDRLAELAWKSRHTITFYDGLYVALATILGIPLLTGDVKLSKAPGLSCAVEVFS